MIYLLLYILVVSGASIAIKLVLNRITPLQLIMFEAAGMVIIAVIAFIWQKALPPKSTWLVGGIIGLAMASWSLLYVLAIDRLPLGLVLVLSNTYVVLSVIASVIFLNERFTLLQAIGIVFTLVGVTCLLLPTT
jgi:drug/metabolite transporter (DMT)-like permease